MAKIKYILIYITVLSCFTIKSQNVPHFVQNVYNQMFAVMDNGYVLKPKLTLSTHPETIVNYYPSNNQIQIGTEFIALARNFGADSNNVIAQVLGHELAHILLQQNDLIKNVGSGYASKEYSLAIKKIHNALKDSVYERQADEYACFYAHIAGYNVIDITPILLDSIYTHFKLTDKQLKNYPKLSERKKIAIITGKRMAILNNLFDKAILATISDKYEIAIALYETILKEKFISSEVYNNLGLVYLINAIHKTDTVQFPYIFPIQFDTKTKLNTTRNLQSTNQILLTEAIRYFDLATKNNKKYATAWLNKSIAEFLIENFDDAEISLLMANKTSDSVLLLKNELLKTLIQYHTGDKTNALANLNKLSVKSNLAQLNLNKLNSSTLLPALDNLIALNPIKSKCTNLPAVDFYSAIAKQSDSLKHVLSIKPNFSYKILLTDSFLVEKIQLNNLDIIENILLYSTIQNEHFNNLNFDTLFPLAKSAYTSNYKQYLVFDNLILVFIKNQFINWYCVQ